MGVSSKIEWTDATWNPWQGCTKVSEACAHCYMFRDLARYGRDPTVVVRSKPPTFRLPLKRHRPLARGLAGEYVIPAGWKVFTCSWSDWFHPAADAWRGEAWDLVRARPDLIFQIVTKRPARIPECLPADWGNGWPHVWLIVTAENQQRAEERIPHLLRAPAAVRGLSCEPLLGPLELLPWLFSDHDRASMDNQYFAPLPGTPEADRFFAKINWVIAGGESGPHARPMHPDWARGLRDQCEAAGVPFFFKQWGEWAPCDRDAGAVSGKAGCTFVGFEDGSALHKVGKAAAGRLLDGREWNEFPSLGEPVLSPSASTGSPSDREARR
jgi:protein gp37